MGERSESGWWYYFAVTFALKTPLALFGLLGLSFWGSRRKPVPWRTECFLWMPVLIYLAVTWSRNLNIGHRHLLPIYPFLFAAAGRAALLAEARTGLALVGLLAAGYAGSVLHVHPHYLAYFNELVGGPANGY